MMSLPVVLLGPGIVRFLARFLPSGGMPQRQMLALLLRLAAPTRRRSLVLPLWLLPLLPLCRRGVRGRRSRTSVYYHRLHVVVSLLPLCIGGIDCCLVFPRMHRILGALSVLLLSVLSSEY